MNKRLRVLIACEFSGICREAMRSLGHDAMSCDFLETEIPGPHYVGDVRDVLNEGWDMMLAFPPCTYLCSSGLHWNKRVAGRAEQTEAALDFVRLLLDAPIDRIALENPVGCISTRIRKPDQKIQPYEFGENASKTTCLWLKNLPRLSVDATQRVLGRWVKEGGEWVERWGNQCDGGQNALAPSEDRWMMQSRTYPGIARAMANQWGGSAGAPREFVRATISNVRN